MSRASVYVLESTCGLTKVGYSNDPERRRREVERDRGLQLRIARRWDPCENADKIEALAHRRLGEWHVTGELFSASVEDCIAAIEDAFEVAATGALPAWASLKLLTRNAGRHGDWATKTIRFPPALEAEINSQIDARLDRPDFAGMVRELVAEALGARKRRAKR